jgi:hypothetical protein
MAKIILASWMVRYPLGGNLSWALQQLLGYKELGHDIYLVEKYGYYNSCYDPQKDIMTNDCSYGLKTVANLLSRYGLEGKWCYVEYGDIYHGMTKKEVENLFRSADLFVDAAPDGSWTEEAKHTVLRVLIDGEPGFSQINSYNDIEAGHIFRPDEYDYYYTNGKNIGRPGNPVPTLGLRWGHIYSPVVTAIFQNNENKSSNGYTTIMNWQSHKPIVYNGKTFGQKDVEFKKFITLPKKVKQPCAVATSGDAPHEELNKYNWKVESALHITASIDSFVDYIVNSRGEFSVCKNVFVKNNTGWFSDKSAIYLANKKPVVVQDTGFSDHLPVGKGLFAVKDVDEAAAAIEEIESNYKIHSEAAYEIAKEYLDATKVLKIFLNEIGV